MRTKNECVNAAAEVLEAHGIRNIQLANGSKHPQLRFLINGVPRFYSVCGTPSDWRSPENTKRDMRQFLKKEGVISSTPEPRPTTPPRQPNRIELLERRIAALERAVFTSNAPKEVGKHDR
jgi:hypothetical protein